MWRNNNKRRKRKIMMRVIVIVKIVGMIEVTIIGVVVLKVEKRIRKR